MTDYEHLKHNREITMGRFERGLRELKRIQAGDEGITSSLEYIAPIWLQNI